MDWEEYLITLYLRICKDYQSNSVYSCERFTNGGRKSFTDEEAMVIYVFGVLRGFKNLKRFMVIRKTICIRGFQSS